MHTDSGLYLLVVFPGLALASPGNTQARVSFRFRPYPWVPPLSPGTGAAGTG